jgi:arsenate reductase (glutaredoxin)
MIKIYHNPRCSKSREGVEYLKNSGKEFEIREYLKNPLTEAELIDLLEKLKLAPIQLVRKNEAIWKENYKSKDLKEDELVKIMVENPKLIERPIIESKDDAVIGRPATNIDSLLK